MFRFLAKSPLSYLFAPAILVLYYYLQEHYWEKEQINTIEYGLWSYFSFLKQIPQFYIIIFQLVLTVLNAILLNFFFNIHNFNERANYSISVFYILLLSYNQTFFEINGLIISHTFIILGLFQLFKLENNTSAKDLSFNIGFLFSLACTFNTVLLFILPFLILGLIVIRPFVLRETILLILGFCLPFIYFIASYYFYAIDFDYTTLFNFGINKKKYDYLTLINAGLFYFLFLIGIIAVRLKAQKSSIKFRKQLSVLNVLIGFSILLSIAQWFIFQHKWANFMAIFLALFLPFTLISFKNTFLSNLLLYTIFIFSVIKFFIFIH